jgi:hypothetical protein
VGSWHGFTTIYLKRSLITSNCRLPMRTFDNASNVLVSASLHWAKKSGNEFALRLSGRNGGAHDP